MAVITDSTLTAIKNELATRNGHIKDFLNLYADKSYAAIQANVQAGLAKDLYDNGDEIPCKYTYNNTEYDFPWIVVDNNRTVVHSDLSEHPGLVLQAKYATIESIQFDAAEATTVDSSTETTAQDGWYYWGKTGNTYTALNLSAGDAIPFDNYDSVQKCGINDLNAMRYGYNRYRDSAYRQWLNSSAGAGSWWASTHMGDKAPNELNSYAGFMAGLPSDFLAVINPVKVQVAANTVTDGGVTDVMYDKFYLPSIEEMYGSPQAPLIEGPYFPYWKTKTGLNAPSNSANSGRIITAVNAKTTAQSVRCRSAYRGGAGNTWADYTSGELNSYYSNYSVRCAPVCVIS